MRSSADGQQIDKQIRYLFMRDESDGGRLRSVKTPNFLGEFCSEELTKMLDFTNIKVNIKIVFYIDLFKVISFTCKLEQMVNRRFTWVLKKDTEGT